MKTLLLGIFCCAVFLSFLTPVSLATTYYIRPDGGTAKQCNGTVDASYPGSGTDQPCAWAHPFWGLDTSGNWKIQGGDTLIIRAGSYRMGYGVPNTEWCDPGGAFDCFLPPLPSGPDAQNPTRILGMGWDSGCTNPPELWGTERVYYLLNLQGTSNATIGCLELTDHSGCVEFHTNPTVRCERDNYPYGDWAGAGIYASDSSNVILRHLNIHGLADRGIYAGRIADWTVEDVRIAGNGWAGWDGDIDGDDSNSNTLTFRRWTVEWNGCAETYPDEQPDHCWDQSAGGYGDGVGTGATAGHWIIEDSIFRHNTSDGLDLFYVGVNNPGTMVEVRRTIAVGNAGNPIKISGPSVIMNTLSVANCGFFYQKPFAQEMSDHCRAGGNAIAINLYRGDSVSVVNSTIVGQGDVLVAAECRVSGQCDGSERVSLQNNVLMGYEEFPPGSGDWTALLWDPNNFTNGRIDYNVIYSVKDIDLCPFGSHDICADPLFINDTLDSFDGHLQVGSPAIDSGLPVGAFGGLIPADDLEGNLRPFGAGVDRGAYEYGAMPGVAPDIKANGLDGPVTIPQGDNLTVTISLNPVSHEGEDADWWVAATSPFGLYWFTLNRSWVRSNAPIRVYGGPLFSLSSYTVLEMSTLPVGDYAFYFGVDDNMDGILDATSVDSVLVDIQ